jgi:hypothetical protein
MKADEDIEEILREIYKDKKLLEKGNFSEKVLSFVKEWLSFSES